MAKSVLFEASTAITEAYIASKIESGELSIKEAKAERRQMLRSAKTGGPS